MVFSSASGNACAHHSRCDFSCVLPCTHPGNTARFPPHIMRVSALLLLAVAVAGAAAAPALLEPFSSLDAWAHATDARYGAKVKKVEGGIQVRRERGRGGGGGAGGRAAGRGRVGGKRDRGRVRRKSRAPASRARLPTIPRPRATPLDLRPRIAVGKRGRQETGRVARSAQTTKNSDHSNSAACVACARRLVRARAASRGRARDDARAPRGKEGGGKAGGSRRAARCKGGTRASTCSISSDDRQPLPSPPLVPP